MTDHLDALTRVEFSSTVSLELERAVLAAPLVSPRYLQQVVSTCIPELFAPGPNRHIYLAYRDMAEAGGECDIALLREALRHNGTLDTVGLPYIVGLDADLPDPTRTDTYIQRLGTIQRERELQSLCLDVARNGATPHALEALRTAVDDASAVGAVKEGVDMVDLLAEAGADEDVLPSVPTGCAELDKVLGGGFLPGQFVIIAGRPGMGKSSLALGAALHAAREGTPTLYWSLEMPRREVGRRAASNLSGIPYAILAQGESRFCQSDIANIARARRDYPRGLTIEDSTACGIVDVASKARALHSRGRLRCLIIDYLQLMKMGREDNRNLQVGAISRALKILAMDLDIPVVAVSQLSRKDRKPRLEDLRDSGSLEQDADTVLICYREDGSSDAEIMVAKQRNGATGDVHLFWAGPNMQFMSPTVWGEED